MGRWLTILTVFIVAFPLSVGAQESNDLERYVPPPMFGGQRAVPPKSKSAKETKMPAISQPVRNSEPVRKPVAKPAKPKKIISKPKKAPAPPVQKPTHPKTTFQGKAVTEIPEAPKLKIDKIEKNEVILEAEPIELIKKPKTVKKTKSVGVVKGPKTMPAVKKQGVETEVLFAPTVEQPITIIDRVQKEEAQKSEEIKQVAINQNFTLPSFNIASDGSRNLNMLFTNTQKTLNDEQKNTINQLIIPFLQRNSSARLRLSAYASPQEDGLNGDRKLSLSRAMAIRKEILVQDIEPNRLDIRSLGAQTDVQPMDRVELFFAE